MQGKWELVLGLSGRTMRTVNGQRITVSQLTDSGEVVRTERLEFELRQEGTVRIIDLYRAKGGGARRHLRSLVYTLTDKTWTEAKVSTDQGTINVWKHIAD